MEMQKLLETIRPAYLILKPSLHGGFSGCEKWIEMAEKYNSGWWITSALESNIGLNAIAQWTFQLNPKGEQGLGTGQLFSNNFPSPLEIDGDRLWFRKKI
jgi:O-succinylbenzoate synthase